jgi:hypothetical protein
MPSSAMNMVENLAAAASYPAFRSRPEPSDSGGSIAAIEDAQAKQDGDE